MTYSFTVMEENKEVADITICDGKLTQYVLHDGSCSSFYCDKVEGTIERVYRFLESRIPPRERENIDEILADYGLEEYDVYKFNRLTHGVDFGDFCWIKFPGENLTWEDVRPEWRK